MGPITLRWFTPVLLCATALLAGCATDSTNIDPYEKTNRCLYNFNEGLDRVALKPLSDIYVHVFPRIVRKCLGNAFDNVAYGDVILNDLLQAKFRQGVGDFGRFAVNSTVGIAGLIDVGTRINLPAHKNDFGITLGLWGAKSGPYIFIPLFGPSCFRDVPDFGTAYVTNPLSWVSMPWYASVPLAVTATADARARGELAVKFRGQAAIDPYVFTRDAYLQYREQLIHPGQSPQTDQSLYDFDDTSPATQPADQSQKSPTQPNIGNDSK